MIYAEVLVDQKTQGSGIFTYFIKPEQLPDLKVGSLVEVPFRNRKVQGIIWKLTPRTKTAIAEKLKSIRRIITSFPILDPLRLQLAQWMVNYYYSSLPEIVFQFFPKVSGRFIKSYPSYALPIKPKPITKKTLPFFFNGQLEKRLALYLNLIEKAHRTKKGVIVLLPDLSFVQVLGRRLPITIKENFAIYHSQLRSIEKQEIFFKILTAKIKIILGTRAALFLPVHNLSLIILDRPSSLSHLEEHAPYYQAKAVAQKLSEFSGISLLLADEYPDLETYWQISKKRLKALNLNLSLPAEIQIIPRPYPDLISWGLEREIKKSAGKILLYLNRKGFAQAQICRDCGQLASCPNCQLPLRIRAGRLFCPHCTQDYPTLMQCLNCHGVRFKERGGGLDRLAQEVKEKFGLVPGIVSENHVDLSPKIILATNKIFQIPPPKQTFELAAAIDPDRDLLTHNFRSSEEVFLNLLRANFLTKRLLIQTRLANSVLYQSLKQKNLTLFYQTELAERAEYGWPPHTKLVKLSFSDHDQAKVKKAAEKMENLLKKLSQIEFFGPYLDQVHGVFQALFILRSAKSHLSILNKISSSWKIQASPQTLF